MQTTKTIFTHQTWRYSYLRHIRTYLRAVYCCFERYAINLRPSIAMPKITRMVIHINCRYLLNFFIIFHEMYYNISVTRSCQPSSCLLQVSTSNDFELDISQRQVVRSTACCKSQLVILNNSSPVSTRLSQIMHTRFVFQSKHLAEQIDCK